MAASQVEIVGVFTRMIYTLIQIGLSHTEAENITLTEANELIAAHWQANGIDLEPMGMQDHGITHDIDRALKFETITNREKKWPSEQL